MLKSIYHQLKRVRKCLWDCEDCGRHMADCQCWKHKENGGS